MYDRGEGLQGFASAPAQRRRFAAVLALIGLAGIGGARRAAAEPEAPGTVATRQGWQFDLTGFVQADSVAWSQASVDELDPSTREPLNEERFLVRRGLVRAEAHKGSLSAAIELDGDTQNGPPPVMEDSIMSKERTRFHPVRMSGVESA